MSISHREQQLRFQSIVERNRSIIYKVCYMYATDGNHLKDLMQDVMANIWQGVAKFRGDSQESTWVYRVTLNTCITDYRRNEKHVSTTSMEHAADVADTAGNQEHQMMLKEMYQLISQLDKIDKALIMLWLDEYSYEEMAQLTGLSRVNVASRIHRARQRLIRWGQS